MPIYEYRCENDHVFEVMQRMTDDPVTSCEVCGAPVQRVFHPVAVHFKGSGFYNTDYGKRRRGGGSDEGEKGKGESGDSSSSDKGSDDSSKGESKSSASSSSSSSSGSGSGSSGSTGSSD
jgi:putative FmdB family regulatory protein